jgi:hypothetical protein
VGQTRAVMSGDAVEKDRLSLDIRQKVGRLGHLLQGRPRPAHRHNKPAHSRFIDDFGLSNVLGIVAIDRRQCHDRFNPLTGNDRPQRLRTLPGSAYETTGDDNT